MEIPKYCGSVEFVRSLDSCQQKIRTVRESFDAGGFVEKDLKDFILTARRAALVCSELIKWHNLKMSFEAAAKEEDPDLQGMHWE